MKKILLITLVAMMLLSMVAFAGCKPKAEPAVDETVVPMDQPVAVDTAAVVAPVEATPAPATK